MTQPETSRPEMVDLVFPLAGHSLARDHAQPLANALGAALPWLDAEPCFGVHPVKLVPGTETQALLSNRARLLLRVPRSRLAGLAALTGHRLDVGGAALRLGSPQVRELLPHATLYAFKVAAPGSDELEFMEQVAAELDGLQVRGQRVCGKRGALASAGAALVTFSLMLHGLSREHSLLVQQRGVGGHRLLGCGIFVPHKSAAAVGA